MIKRVAVLLMASALATPLFAEEKGDVLEPVVAVEFHENEQEGITFVVTDDLSGTVTISFPEPSAGWGSVPEAVWMNPDLRIELPAAASQVPTELIVYDDLPRWFEVRREYEVDFRLVPHRAYIRRLEPQHYNPTMGMAALGNRPLGAWIGGDYTARAVLVSSTPLHPDERPHETTPHLYGRFESEPFEVEIMPGYPAIHSLTNKPRGLRLLDLFPPDERYDVIAHYVRAGHFVERDLLQVMANAEPVLKGRLAELYAEMDFDLGKLDFFFLDWPRAMTLEENYVHPFFYLKRPGEVVDYHLEVQSGQHGVHTSFHESLPPPMANRGSGFTMPRRPGVYRMTCPFDGNIWGWFLVRGEPVQEQHEGQDHGEDAHDH